jgi:hypothetical protein
MTVAGDAGGSITLFRIDPRRPGRVLAFGLGLLDGDRAAIWSEDSGTTWHGAQGIRAEAGDYGLPFAWGAAIDPYRSGSIMLQMLSGAVYHSADGGLRWHRSGSRSVTPIPDALAVSDGVTLMGGEHGLVRSDDAGVKWRAVRGSIPRDTDVLSVVAIGRGRFRIGTARDGYWRTTSRGRQARETAYRRTAAEVHGLAVLGGRLVAGTWSQGVLLRPAGGGWQPAAGLPPYTRIHALAAFGDHVYAAAGVAGLWASNDGGATFSKALSASIGTVAVDAGGAWAGGPAGLYQADGHGPFVQASAGLPAKLQVSSIALGSGEVAVDAVEGFYVSAGGAAFERRSAGGAYSNPLANEADDPLAIDPRDAAHIFRGVQRSTDGGRTWTAGKGVDFGNERSHLIDPGHPDLHYLATGVGVWRSTDDGLNYTWLSFGNFWARALAFDSAGRLLAGGPGVLRLDP